MLSAKKIFTFSPILMLVLPSAFSCAKDNSYEYLRVLNSEDYIYKQNTDTGFLEEDLTIQFEKYMAKKGRKIRVIYDTYDTNENMFNTLKTGKTTYDLICASDYMIEKIANLDLLDPLDIDKIPNYKQYASNFITSRLKKIATKDGKTLNDYATCYMWGTLGLVFNPNYSVFKSRNINESTVINDMQNWLNLWDNKYNHTISIKDSMRDTYAIGILKHYSDQFLDPNVNEEQRLKIFNYGGASVDGVNTDIAKTHINEVKKELVALRNNIFGFEVDGGKEDIVTKKIGIDLAWSGDAVYSIKKARNKKETTNPFNLYYALPIQGANLWFDGWALEKNANKELAYEFLNFISDPKNAIQNMRYIGFTSAIAGDDVFNYMNEMYHSEDADALNYNLKYFFGDDDKYVIKVSQIDNQGQMLAQYPRSDYVNKLLTMKDYGDNNDLILSMWQDVKHEPLPLWAVILIIVQAGIIVSLVSFFIIKKKHNKKRRHLRLAKTIETK